MPRSKLIAVGLAQILCVSLLASVALLSSAPVAADHSGNEPATHVVEQGDRCVELAEVGDGTETVESFYDYRGRDGRFNSFGTDEYQETATSQLFVHHGSQGVNLVFLHDRRGDEAGGGAVTMSISNLPAQGEWAVEDDDYPDQDDRFQHGETSSRIDWMWAPNRTDGGAYRGLHHLGDGDRISIDPAFSEESWAYQDRDPRWTWSGNDVNWAARSENGLVSLDESQPVTVGPGTCAGEPPVADLTATPNPASPGERVTLDASGSSDDGSVVEYRWDLDGDGTVDDTTDSAQYFRTFEEQTTVTVTVVDDDGMESTASVTVQIEDTEPPTARASANETTVAAGDAIAFDASASSDDEGSVSSYEWDFGDGTTATGATVTHTYDSAGEYTAQVTVRDDSGNENTTTVPIEVTAAGPTASLQAPDAVQVGEQATFDASGSTGDPVEYRWEVAGETNTTQEPTLTRTFESQGTVDVTLTVVDSEGRTDSASTTVEVVADDEPAAVIQAPDAATVGETVTFDGSQSSDNGTIESYEWSLGDGTDTTGQTVGHAYDEPGEYTVSLTVTDDTGNQAQATRTINVTGDQGPTADLAAPAETGIGASLSLDASGSSAPSGIETYRWDADADGQFETETNGPSHVTSFNETGTYTVRVQVVSGNGETATAEATVEVVDAAPIVGITGDESGETGQAVTLSAEASDDRGVERIEWDLGDGTTATGTTVTHTYDSAGEYEVTATAVDTSGNEGSTTRNVTIGESGSDEGPNGGGNGGDDGNQADENDDASSGGGGGGGGGGGISSGERDTSTVETDLGGDGAEVDVSETDDGTRIEVDGAGDDETVDVSLDERDGASVTSLALSTSADGEASVLLSQSTNAMAPAGTDVVFAAATPEDADGVDDVDYEFTVLASTLADRETDADDLTVVRRTDDGWEPVATSVERQGSTVAVSADVDGVAPVVLAASGSAITAEDVEVDGDAVVGDQVPVRVTLANEGTRDGTRTLQLMAGGRAVDSREVTVDAGETETVELTASFQEAGERSLSVAGTRSTVDVAANEPDVRLADVTVEDDQIQAGEQVRVVATYVNDGHAAGEATANFSVFGEQVAVERVEVGPGERANVTFTQQIDAAGTYDVAVDDEQRTVEVLAEDETATEATSDPSDADAGVGGGLPMLIAGGVVALLLLAAASSRAMG